MSSLSSEKRYYHGLIFCYNHLQLIQYGFFYQIQLKGTLMSLLLGTQLPLMRKRGSVKYPTLLLVSSRTKGRMK